MSLLFLYLAGNETAQNLYLKKRSSSLFLSSTVTPSSSPSKKTKTNETRVWAKAVVCLLTTKSNATFTDFSVNDLQDFFDKGFDEERYSSNRLYKFKQAIIREVLPLLGVSVFRGVTSLPYTQATMTTIFRGALCKDFPEDERKETLLLGCYNPPSKEVLKKIKDKETKALIHRALDQPHQHCNKKSMNVH